MWTSDFFLGLFLLYKLGLLTVTPPSREAFSTLHRAASQALGFISDLPMHCFMLLAPVRRKRPWRASCLSCLTPCLILWLFGFPPVLYLSVWTMALLLHSVSEFALAIETALAFGLLACSLTYVFLLSRMLSFPWQQGAGNERETLWVPLACGISCAWLLACVGYHTSTINCRILTAMAYYVVFSMSHLAIIELCSCFSCFSRWLLLMGTHLASILLLLLAAALLPARCLLFPDDTADAEAEMVDDALRLLGAVAEVGAEAEASTDAGIEAPHGVEAESENAAQAAASDLADSDPQRAAVHAKWTKKAVKYFKCGTCAGNPIKDQSHSARAVGTRQYTCRYIYTYIFIHIYIYRYAYIYIYIYMYMYIYTRLAIG